MGIKFFGSHYLTAFDGHKVMCRCIYTDKETSIDAESLLLVTARTPNDRLYHEFIEYRQNNALEKTIAVTKIGDCDAPNIIAEAVFAGHKFAREFDASADESNIMKIDKVFYPT